MDGMEIIERAIKKFALTCEDWTILQDKDGVTVARLHCGGETSVLKCFANEAYRREIRNYRLLQQLGIPTIRVLASTDTALLLEDIDRSPVWRLSTSADMEDERVMRALAGWYRGLHRAGRAYVALHGAGMYDESDYFTRENLTQIRLKTGTQTAPVWVLLEQTFDVVYSLLRRIKSTLTYNDFDYTNCIVARDGSDAMMFDYNLLGKGGAYTDLRNVTWNLSPRARDTFLSTYGATDPLEATVDAVVSPAVTLYMACQRDNFPAWGSEALEEICSASYMGKVKSLMEDYA